MNSRQRGNYSKFDAASMFVSDTHAHTLYEATKAVGILGVVTTSIGRCFAPAGLVFSDFISILLCARSEQHLIDGY